MDTQIRHLLAYKKLPLLTIQIEEPLLAAVALMNSYHVGSILVLHGNVLVGIFTERDILTKVIGRFDPMAISVGDVMTENPITITPNTSVRAAMAIINEKRCRHLPVVDEDEVIGVISSGDINRWIVESQETEIIHLHQYISG